MEKYSEEKIFEFLKERRVDKAMGYMASCVPDYLSKFYSLTADEELNEKKLNCLADDCNWYDSPNNQNDPFDMRMGYVDEMYAKKAGLSQEIVEVEKMMLKSFVERMLLSSFVDSDYSNLPMWAYYANNYQGYCVNYKISRKEIFFKVIYQKNKILVNELFLSFIKFCVLEEHGYDVENEQDMIAFLARLVFSIKHSTWRHEKEFRIISPLYSDIGKRIPNIKMGLAVNDITIGLKCKSEHIERIKKIAKERNLKCYQLEVDQEKFLTRKPIDL